MTTETTNKPKPIHKIRIPGASAAIWQNTSQKGKTWYSVGFDRSYKDANGNWKQTSMFGVDDLLALSHIAAQAHDFIRKSSRRMPRSSRGHGRVARPGLTSPHLTSHTTRSNHHGGSTS